jgi:hypothetical protein
MWTSLFCSTTLNLCGEMRLPAICHDKWFLKKGQSFFHAILDFGDDGSWYNWCLVKWVSNNEQHNTYPGKILGFFSNHNSVYAVIQSSSDLITMEQLCENFICNFVVEDIQKMVVVEIEIISNPSCAHKNYGGPLNSYFCVLPRRKWGSYFGEKIPSE